MREEALLKQTQGRNTFKWNWNNMKKIGNKREKRPHPYQREERREDRGEGGSRTMGQIIGRLNGLIDLMAK